MTKFGCLLSVPDPRDYTLSTAGNYPAIFEADDVPTPRYRVEIEALTDEQMNSTINQIYGLAEIEAIKAEIEQ